MGAHTPHPDSHTHGLCDDCPECQKRIEQPLLMDDANLRRVWRGEHHTRTDVKVYDALYRACTTHQRLQSAFGVSADDRRGAFAHGGKA